MKLIPKGWTLVHVARRVKQIPRQVFVRRANRAAKVRALRGKYAWVQTSGEAFNQRKQTEIELER